jgi:hypothetical protein
MNSSKIDLFPVVVSRTLRVPTPDTAEGTLVSAATTVYLDSKLMELGFKMNTALLRKLASLSVQDVGVIGRSLYHTVETMVGAHVKHNPLFKTFPDVVFDVHQWWRGFSSVPSVCHTFEEMLGVHDEYLEKSANKYKVLDVGDSLPVECGRLFAQMAESPLPMTEDDKAIFDYLCVAFGNYVVPSTIPVAETRAIVNGHRLRQELPLAVQSSTDILRAIAHRCGAPTDLIAPFKFKSLPRRERALIGNAFNVRSSTFFDGVPTHKEQWKRAFERLHPYEIKSAGLRYAADVAFGKIVHTTPMGYLELYFSTQDLGSILDLARKNPGIIVRSMDRILRTFPEDYEFIVGALPEIVSGVSTRVLVGLYNSLDGRDVPAVRRAFTNTKGKTHVQEGDTRNTIPSVVTTAVRDVLKRVIAERIFGGKNVVVGDESILHMAVPTSEKNGVKGVGSWSVGSRLPVKPVEDARILRFFMYWRETAWRTDYDLSVLLLDRNLNLLTHCSFRSLLGSGLTHSGDITTAPRGASEFIDVDTLNLPRGTAHIVPCVNVFAGESFNEVKESFFGYMLRDSYKGGAPFEPLSVETKTNLRGEGQVSIPMMFSKVDALNRWESLTLNLFSKGQLATDDRTLQLIKGVYGRSYLTFYDLYRETKVDPSLPTVYLGVNAPLDGTYDTVITINNVTDIL